MTFFCSKCQKRHDVADISADMWSICKEKVGSGISDITTGLDKVYESGTEASDQIFALYNELSLFIKTPEPNMRSKDGSAPAPRVNAFFALNRKNLSLLRNVKREDKRVHGTYTVTLEDLLEVYKNWEGARQTSSIEFIPEEWYSHELCQEDVAVYFAENGVLDKVTDHENVPFSRDGKKLGFVHICPHCGCVLSRASGAAEEIVVALAGSPRAGKTSSMVAMFHSLLNGNCPGVKIIPMEHDEKWESLKQDIDHYANCVKVEKTPNEIPEVPAHSVLLQVNDTKRVLTMVDMAGEFWEAGDGLSDEFFKMYAEIYEHIDCIWFLISKATVSLSRTAHIPEEINEKLLSNVSEDEEIIKASDSDSLYTNLSMLKTHLTKNRIPPIIVVVTKPDHMVDALDEERTIGYRLFPSDNVTTSNADEVMQILRGDRVGHYSINQGSLRAHADDVRAYLNEVSRTYIDAIESNCADHFYASLAPYGCPAKDILDSANDKPVPYHELVPFLWTMAIQGVMKVNQRVVWLKRSRITNQIVSKENATPCITFYHTRRRIPEGAGKAAQKNRDLNLVYETISNNLLMNGDKYIGETVIPHPRA